MNDMTDSESEDENITLHTAKCIIDNTTYVYFPKVTNMIKQGLIVRISFECKTNIFWNHDAPFVNIIEIDRDSNILGEVLNIRRIENTNSYPLAIGDRIWFKKENIIEIPNFEEDPEFNKMLTIDRVQCTGPLYTVKNDDSSDDESEESYSSVSDSD